MLKISNRKGMMALSPLIVFVVLYLVASIVAGDFYKVPITVAFLIASVFAIATSPNAASLTARIQTFSRGAATENMMLMLWIFVMAGAFAAAAKEMGSIEATVGLTLRVLPGNMVLAGLFLASCLVSVSIGTSVGTIVALTPIAAGISHVADLSLPLVTALVVGGSFFGDNLSFISDTTVAATRTQGCKMSDKFRANSFVVMPAAVVVLVVYVVMGSSMPEVGEQPPVDWLRVLPYLVVLVAAVLGMNVMAVLAIGLAMTGVIGMADGSYDLYGWFGAMGKGITNMGELIIITMMAGGLLETVRANGGIDYIIGRVTRHVSSKRGAELSIALMVSIVNVCTANNTVAIITVGGIAKQIGDRFGVDSRKAASILDTFSCTVQGLLPYGAQMLMAAGLAKISPIEIIPYLYYPMITGIVALVAIVLRYPKHYS